ncbi:MAG: di-heme oxidoredictase family protein [Planctomycetota bacterium]
MKRVHVTHWAAAAVLLGAALPAQFAERSALMGSGEPGVDCSGRSVKNKRVRAIHEPDASRAGGTGYFFDADPFLAYQLGRNLNFREFRERDGVFDLTVAGLAGPMPDGTTAKITANNQTSCLGCHNLPQGNPGGGPNFHKDSGFGRNTPHYYGGGIVEMLAIQVREELLSQLDTNGDGWVSAAESRAAGASVSATTGPRGESLDFGRPSLSRGATGTPSFNNIVRVWYVDQNGRTVAGASEVDGVSTHGYNFELIVWGWGQGTGRSALNPTNRAFLWDPWKAHGGLEAYDPSTMNDPDGDGVSEPTLAGAIQFPATHNAPDLGASSHRLGYSTDDPDGDGYLNEISEGDLDLAEWFMLNAPRPAFAGTPGEYRRGVAALDSLGCTDCHTADWTIRARSATPAGRRAVGPEYAGDRRFFDLDVTWNTRTERLEGKLVPLYDKVGASYVRRHGAFAVRGFFSDLRHHEMGEGFAELDFGGTFNTEWRTPPLWGVGSGFPWGHDGQSLTIEDAIRRHGGEGLASRNAYNRASRATRQLVLSTLRKMVLYDIETLPADIDGDGKIAKQFVVAGTPTGRERFNAEWLFAVPVQIQGLVRNFDGKLVRSFAAVNLDAAYGQGLPLRVDSDDDGWPDVWDAAPAMAGYRDGVR